MVYKSHRKKASTYMKTLDKGKYPAVSKALIQRRHRSLMLKLDDFKTFSSPAASDSDDLLFYGIKTALKRAFKSKNSQNFNDCSDSQNTKVKKLNT